MASKVENNYKVNPEKVRLETDQGIVESEERKWRMPLKDVYKHGLAFYKDKEGKALHLSYEDRLKLVAYTQQTSHGPLDVNSAPPLGVLDVIGRDRRAAWQALGQMSQIQAMAGFVHTLDRLCPLFKPYLEAIQKDMEDKKNQEQRIKDALNAQTYEQFLQYAQQQYPGNFDQQAILIRQLQDKHYQQYIQQLAVDQRLANSNINVTEDKENDNINNEKEKTNEESDNDCNLNEAEPAPPSDKSMQTSEKTDNSEYIEEVRVDDNTDDDEGYLNVEEVRMWTRGDIAKFKSSAKQGGGKLTVGHGETITVRVPTHPKARCLCWEFATDNYDIGFGIYFEWTKSPTTEVTVHVAESDEDDEEDADDDEYPVGDGSFHEYTIHGTRADLELGSDKRPEKPTVGTSRPLTSLVVPIYRRDCHTEVYAGSHTYPGEGVYLLKFDNTYSLWRSKTLYYKVYYTQ
ncbi:hypothetical protein HW555_001517 [Spodoptera exigua]|uniref:Golgi resident protein GCP60 n=1 Tax=Spodoptera exigua TaxID=7107 RepID=A0A835GSQ2_SPOEX|nr:hypothetical protein HW555_001517 [Spodoptera exigua]